MQNRDYLDQSLIDLVSDGLKRAVDQRGALPAPEIIAWYINTSHGPEFFTGRITAPPRNPFFPLFGTPAYPDQQPAGWKALDGQLICAADDRTLYRDDMKWRPLYSAR